MGVSVCVWVFAIKNHETLFVSFVFAVVVDVVVIGVGAAKY